MTGDGRPIRVESIDGGDLVRILLARPPGNIIDSAMIAALSGAIEAAARRPSLRAVVLEGEGADFSFGVSVEEHLPEDVAAMLDSFHGLLRRIIATSRPFLAAVRGRCLGGGLELAAFCHRVFADSSARLGQPEIALGVFAPVGSLVLPRRLSQADADDLLLSGRIVTAEEADRMGLVDELDDDPSAAALGYARESFGDKSAAALSFATRAARWESDRAFLRSLDAIERLYLEELMALRDPEIGLRAFLDKSKPDWTHQ